jgi:preprotein translocase subunit YajC
VGGFLIIIILFAAAWFVLAVPARRRRTAHAAMQDSVGIGSEVITAGGMHGIVQEIDEDDIVHLEVAPSVVVRIDRRAIAAVATEVELEPDEELDEPEEEPEEEPEDATEPERDSGSAPEHTPGPR